MRCNLEALRDPQLKVFGILVWICDPAIGVRLTILLRGIPEADGGLKGQFRRTFNRPFQPDARKVGQYRYRGTFPIEESLRIIFPVLEYLSTIVFALLSLRRRNASTPIGIVEFPIILCILTRESYYTRGESLTDCRKLIIHTPLFDLCLGGSCHSQQCKDKDAKSDHPHFHGHSTQRPL